MFTGLVRAMGVVVCSGADVVRRSTGVPLWVASHAASYGLRPGDSVSICGACMTVCRAVGPMIGACMSYDSLRQLRMLRCGRATNVELPTAPSDLLHGSIASGHVVCTGKVMVTRYDGGSVRLAMGVRRYDGRPIVHKGAIVVDGAALTAIGPDLGGYGWTCSVNLVSVTRLRCTLGTLMVGDDVNIEVPAS